MSDNTRTYELGDGQVVQVKLEDDGVVIDILEGENVTNTSWFIPEDLEELANHPADEFFKITSVHRHDLEVKGFDVSNISDEKMKQLAEKMADDYCNQLFWGSMEILAENMGIPKKEE